MSKVVEGANAATPTASENTDQQQQSEAPSVRDRIASLQGEARLKYDMTGELPEISAPAKKEETPAATSKEGESKPTLEAGPDKEKQEQRRRDRSLTHKDRKIGELSAELRRTQRELEQARQGKPGSNASESTTEKANIDGRPVRPEEPDIFEFDSVDDFKKAKAEYRTKLNAYEDQLQDWRGKQSAAGKPDESTAADGPEKEAKDLIESFDKRAGDFQKTLKDFDGKTKSSKAYEAAFKEVRESLAEIQPDREVIDALLEIGPEGIYYLGTKPEELDRILDLPARRALRELGKIEVALAKAPKPNTVSKAPDPPTNLGGKDEGNDGPAVGSKAWMDAENARDARRILGVTG